LSGFDPSEKRSGEDNALDGASRMMELAQKMLKIAEGLDVQFRVGMNTGPLVAGVIGTQKVWGSLTFPTKFLLSVNCESNPVLLFDFSS
jgi:class 3 adenylate cyclase